MKPIFNESVTVIASDLQNTAWTELFELWQRATALGEHPSIVAELARLIGETKKLHDDILKLAKYFPPEVPE
jgi:hypothetical protein